ncbi:Adhesion G-protein coupled receptor D1 [Exaiptasia diaphana]|nr:Adhesion G-protein coupled receptor D1 [Exaiptasia diaphana]
MKRGRQVKIVKPLPSNLCVIENETAQVTCVAAGINGTRPDKIIFYRQDEFGGLSIIYDEGRKGRIFYENKTEDGGKRLIVTLHINTVLPKDNSSRYGSYECHAFAGAAYDAYGFTVSFISFHELPGIQAYGNLSASIGEKVVLRCRFIPSSRARQLVDGKWFKDGIVTNSECKEVFSTTIINPSDGGWHSCILMADLQPRLYNMTRSFFVSVKPQFFAKDLQWNEVKTIKGKSTNLTCSAKGNPLKTEWKMHLKSKYQTLRPLNVSENYTTYVFSNLDKLEKHTLMIVNVSLADQGKYYCCIHNASRAQDDIDGCQVFTLKVKDLPVNWTSAKFENILQQAEAETYNTSELLSELENVTKKEKISGGDLGLTVKILTILTNRKKFDLISEQQKFLAVCNNILQPMNIDSWERFDEAREKKEVSLSVALIKVLDTYGLILAKQLPRNFSKVIEAPNIAMRLDRISTGHQAKKTGLTFKYEKFQSSLSIPAEVFNGDKESFVVTIVYKTFNRVMGLRGINKLAGQDDIEVFKSTSTIFSSVVDPPMSGRLRNQKVKIVMKNTKVAEESLRRKCVFWKEGLPETWMTDGCRLVPSESNSHVTTCECDHLTVFASLMDPYGGLVAEDDRKALELISTTGCAISLFAILLTIVVTLFFWRVLKSPRTIVLMNICVAIGIVCILVIAEGTARTTKVGCTVLAVLLHYFLLAVFCWFLCEGLLLYLLIVKVIGGGVGEKVKYFVLFGWGFPLLVVGISLCATQTEGYGYHGLQTACWLSVDNGLIWAFIGPAVVIMLINMVVFVLVIRQMMGTRHAQTKSRDEKFRMGVKATAVILPLLGITWVFGLLAFNTATLAFKYIFAIFNSLQGLMIFIFHCVLNQQIKDVVQRRIQSTPENKQQHLSKRINVAANEDVSPFSIENSKKSPKTREIGKQETLQSEISTSTHL